MTPADAESVAGLVFLLLNELTSGQGPDRAEMATIADRVLRLDSVFGCLAVVDDIPAGVILLNERAAIYAGGRFGEISELFVRREYRSGGVARHLVEAAKHLARTRDWPRLEVDAPPQPDWARSLQFFLREEFERVGPRLSLLASAP